MARSVELWWLWRCGGCGVMIGVGVNGFLFCFFSGFAGICDQCCGGCGVVIGVMVLFFFLFCFVDLG